MGAAEEGAVLALFDVVLDAPAGVVLPEFAAAVPAPEAFPQPVAAVIRTEAARPIAISRFMDIFLYLLTFTCLYLEVYQIKGLADNRLRLMQSNQYVRIRKIDGAILGIKAK